MTNLAGREELQRNAERLAMEAVVIEDADDLGREELSQITAAALTSIACSLAVLTELVQRGYLHGHE